MMSFEEIVAELKDHPDPELRVNTVSNAKAIYMTALMKLSRIPAYRKIAKDILEQEYSDDRWIRESGAFPKRVPKP